MKATASFIEMSDLGSYKFTGVLDFSGDDVNELDRDLHTALMRSTKDFVELYQPTVEPHGGQLFNVSLAIVHGAQILLPERVGAREAVRAAQTAKLGFAHLCIRCGDRHLMESVGTFLLDPEMYAPIFAGVCRRCERALFSGRVKL